MNLKKAFNLSKDKVFGLDIGSSTVKVITLRKDGSGYTVTGASVVEITPGDDPNLQTNTVKAIHDCMRSGQIKRKLAVCGISGQEVAVRDFEFPALQADEIDGAVMLEASQVCPFSAADSTVNYQLISETDQQNSNGNNEDKTKGILVAATNTLIRKKVQLVKEAHLKCVLIDVNGLALLNCFNGFAQENNKSQNNQTIAILNVGSSHSTLAIMDTRGRPFIRDMTYAGNNILNQIASENNITTNQVKEILFGDSTEMDLKNSLKKACGKLIADVAETLRYYSAKVNTKKIERLHVCGGFATANGLIELLNNNLSIKAVIWNPFGNINYEKNKLSQEFLSSKGPAMAVAAGLAMRSI